MFFLKILRKFVYMFVFIVILFFGFGFYVNIQVQKNVLGDIYYSLHHVKENCAIVLGASVFKNQLSGALKGRMDLAIELYKKGYVRKILLSGDGLDEYYNETRAMKFYALQEKVNEKDLMIDDEGFSTSVSLIRAQKIYQLDACVIVSQEYHVKRAIWIAQKLGLKMKGLAAVNSPDNFLNEGREWFAVVKDYVMMDLYVILDYFSQEKRGF